MSTQTPPPPPPAGYDRPYYSGGGLPPVPIPSSELVIFFLAWFVILLTVFVADSVNPPAFVTGTIVLSAAYIVSRGIAKLGKVIEGR
jgi:hypothetical protein